MNFYYYGYPLWLMAVLPFTAAVLWGIIGKLIGKYMRVWLGINVVLIAAGLFLIYRETLAGRAVGTYSEMYGAPELVPFSSFTRDPVDDETFRSMFCNVMLFVPFGAGLANLLEGLQGFFRVRRPILVTVATGIVISMVVEIIQYGFGLGLCETDDVIMNGIGMLIGAGSLYLAGKE